MEQFRKWNPSTVRVMIVIVAIIGAVVAGRLMRHSVVGGDAHSDNFCHHGGGGGSTATDETSEMS
jgi:hypothetical protein